MHCLLHCTLGLNNMFDKCKVEESCFIVNSSFGAVSVDTIDDKDYFDYFVFPLLC